MSLCFLEAVQAKDLGHISEKEYISHLTAHLRGVRHDSDQRTDQGWRNYFYWRDQFGSLFRDFALNSRTLSTEETRLYDQLLQQCFAGDLEAIKSAFAEFESDRSLRIPLHALAVLVARKGQPDILDFLLQEGAEFNEQVVAAAARGINSIEMLEFLWNRNWRDVQHSPRQQEHMVLASENDPVMLEFLLRKGAKFPTTMLFEMPSSGKYSLTALKLLVDGCGGAESLKGTAVFTLAVEEGNPDVVEYLCKLGVAINDVPPEFDIREPYACGSPLWAAVKKRDISMMELLLEHGADPNAPFWRDYPHSLLDWAQQRYSDDTELLAVLQKKRDSDGQVDKVDACDNLPENVVRPVQWITPEELGRRFADIDTLW